MIRSAQVAAPSVDGRTQQQQGKGHCSITLSIILTGQLLGEALPCASCHNSDN
jgi:hypothetical protein